MFSIFKEDRTSKGSLTKKHRHAAFDLAYRESFLSSRA